MARPCPECGVLVLEDWRYLCDYCEQDRLLELCTCPHDERDQCVCYDACPAFDYCAGWEAPLLAEWFSRGEPEPVSEPSPVKAPKGRAQRGEP